VPQTQVIAYRGINIGQLYNVLRNNKNMLKQFRIFLLHVGTNNVQNSDLYDIISKFRDVIELIQSVSTNNYILVSSILPRVCDWNTSIIKVVQINIELQKMCEYYDIEFVYTFSSFIRGIHPKKELFAKLDGGLHLNNRGTSVLRARFINCIVKLLRDIPICIQHKPIAFPMSPISVVKGILCTPQQQINFSVNYNNLSYLI
jgi:hypothetical protein